MRRIVTIAFSAGLLAAALPAQAANSSAATNRSDSASQSQAQAANPDDRRICVREASSETRIRRLVCHTAREWRDLHGDDDGN